MQHRVQRLFKLLNLLRMGRSNIETLSQELSVTQRSVFRDIQELRRCGFAIMQNPVTQNYSLLSSVNLPETHFDLEEAMSMVILCLEAGRNRQLPFLEAARRAAMKLLQTLPDAMVDEVAEIKDVLEIRLEPTNPMMQSLTVFQAVLDAMQRLKAVSIDYKSPIEPLLTTTLEPYRLYFGRHAWYVIGRSSLHQETRTFHLGRILECRPTEETYTIPPGFTLKQYFGNAWRMIREPGPDQAVVIRFSPLVGQNVAEVHWHPTQKILQNEDGSIDFHVTVSGLREISWWILGYGKEAEVLKPPALREMIRAHIRDLAAKYAVDET